MESFLFAPDLTTGDQRDGQTQGDAQQQLSLRELYMQYFGPAPLEVFSAQEQYMPPQGLSRYRALPTDAPTAQPAYPTIHHHHHPGMAMPSYQHPNQVPGHGLYINTNVPQLPSAGVQPQPQWSSDATQSPSYISPLSFGSPSPFGGSTPPLSTYSGRTRVSQLPTPSPPQESLGLAYDPRASLDFLDGGVDDYAALEMFRSSFGNSFNMQDAEQQHMLSTINDDEQSPAGPSSRAEGRPRRQQGARGKQGTRARAPYARKETPKALGPRDQGANRPKTGAGLALEKLFRRTLDGLQEKARAIQSAPSDTAALTLALYYSPIVSDDDKAALRKTVRQIPTDRSESSNDSVKCSDCDTDFGVTEWIARHRLRLHRQEHHWPGKCVACGSMVNNRDTAQYRKHRMACPAWLALVERGLHWAWLSAMPIDDLEARHRQFFDLNERAAAAKKAAGDDAALWAEYKRYIDKEVAELRQPVQKKKQRAAPLAGSSAVVTAEAQPLPAADELAVTTTSSSDDPEVPNAPVDTFVDRTSGVYAGSFKREGGYPHADIDEDSVWSAAAEVDDQWNPRTPLVHVRLL